MRKIVATIYVNDERAIEEDIGTIEYLEREFDWLSDSGICLEEARILDDDDPQDAKAIRLVNKIFRME